jgi:antitoxin YefM
METVSLATVKAKLSEYVNVVHDTHQRVMITRNGEPAAVLISPDELESLEETIEVMSDPELMTQIRQSQEELERGEGHSLEEVAAYLDEQRPGWRQHGRAPA